MRLTGRTGRRLTRFSCAIVGVFVLLPDIGVRAESSVEARRDALAVEGVGPSDSDCGDYDDAGARCRLERRFASDSRARAIAERLLDRHRIVVGVEEAYTMDGGFRGLLHLVPAWPVGRYRRLLAWVERAHERIATVLDPLRANAPRPIRYRHTDLVYRFFRSVGRTTPSAYASQWTIGFNVAGSLHRSEDAVTLTLVHEILHLNDEADRFTGTSLRDLHARILARCGGSARCLAPYAPTATRVRGGTFYSFQPNNGDAVMEYGAEVATRWFEEHEALARTGRLGGPAWKCAREENAEAYRQVAARFFGGVDRTPPCGSP